MALTHGPRTGHPLLRHDTRRFIRRLAALQTRTQYMYCIEKKAFSGNPDPLTPD